ncbi:hypothetical protein KW782_01940 [Candidatus Parcubacteria bacterium]|nr:hypothetical protein [Candidatus Parcubacteria bacterium]
MKLPSKKIIPLIIACLIAVISISFAALYPTSSPKNISAATESQFAAVTAEVSIQNRLTERDADGDGLKDWEESLWGTSPNNKDTDGDGTSDNTEINQNRNPAVKGPNDKLETKKETTSSTASAPLTTTEKLARDLFTQYMTLKQTGKEITPGIEQQLVQNFIDASKTTTDTKPTYNLGHLKLTTNTPEALRNYGNAFGKIILSNSFAQFDKEGLLINELVIANVAVEKNNPAELKKIEAMITAYRKIIAGLLALPVPQNVATSHLDFINNLQFAIKADEGLLKVFEDSAQSIVSLTLYQEAAVGSSKAIREVAAYLKKTGIQFSQTDSGYILMNS